MPFSIRLQASIHVQGARPGVAEQIVAAGKAADGLLAVSGALRSDMIALGMAADGIRVHHTGLDLDVFRPVDRAAAKVALGVSGPLLVAAGGLLPAQGPDLAIEALNIGVGATLILVGDGRSRTRLNRAGGEAAHPLPRHTAPCAACSASAPPT